MSKIILAVFFFISYAGISQIIPPNIRQTGFAIEMGGSVLVSMLPSRINTVNNPASDPEDLDYKSYNSFVTGLRGDISVSPFYHDNFSYSFTTNGMLGWLGSNGQSNFYMGHHFRIGLPRIKVVVEFGKLKFQRANYRKSEDGIYYDTEKIASSNYDNTRKFKVGAHYTFLGDQTLCVLFTREKYNPVLSAENAKGVYVEFMTAKRLSFFADFTFGHAVQGYYALPSYIPVTNFNLPETAMAFQVGVRKSIFFSKKYYELTYADDF